MDWSDVVSTLGAFGGVLAFLATLLLAWITSRSNKSLDAFKGEQAERIEHLRADLRAETFRSEAQSARLQERRVDALADVYVKIVAAESAVDLLGDLQNLARYSAATSGQARQAVLDLRDSVRKNRVWLDQALSTELSALEDALTRAWMTLDVLKSSGEANVEPERTLPEDVWPQVRAGIPAAKAAIEQRLRRVLGVLDGESRLPRAINPGTHLPPTPSDPGDCSKSSSAASSRD